MVLPWHFFTTIFFVFFFSLYFSPLFFLSLWYGGGLIYLSFPFSYVSPATYHHYRNWPHPLLIFTCAFSNLPYIPHWSSAFTKRSLSSSLTHTNWCQPFVFVTVCLDQFFFRMIMWSRLVKVKVKKWRMNKIVSNHTIF